MAGMIFRNANLLDGENPAKKGVSIAVEGDRITAITSNATASPKAGDTVIDMTGLTLMPGMVTGHFHAAYNTDLPLDAPPTEQALRALGNANIALRCGYTSVIGAGTYRDIDARVADAIDSGRVDGPRMIPSSRALSPSIIGPAEEDSPYVACPGPEGHRQATLREIENGATMIKLFASPGHALIGPDAMSDAEITAVVETAREHGVRTRAHVAGKEHVLRCVRLGVDIIDHADGMDEECIEAFLEHDNFVLPSMYMPYLTSLSDDAIGANLLHPADYEQMKAAMPKALEAGVKFVPGDDYGYGELPHGTYSGELVFLVDQLGISPLEAIKWATKNGGEMTGIEGLGTLATGNLADMLIIDGDPSVDINIINQPERLVAVIKGGKLMSGKLPTMEPALAG